MIDNLLNDFIGAFGKKACYSQELRSETFYAAIQGDSEHYMRWKFLNHIYNYQRFNGAINFSLSLESFDRNDMIFNFGNTIHFVEWKALTLPIRNQGLSVLKQKKRDNLKQLFKSHGKYSQLNNGVGSRYWSAFVYYGFDLNLINQCNASPTFFDLHGNFQKYGGAKNSISYQFYQKNCAVAGLNINNPDITIGPAHAFNGDVHLFFELYEFTNHINSIHMNQKVAFEDKTLMIGQKKYGELTSEEREDLFLSPYTSLHTVKFPSHTSPETSPIKNLAPAKRRRGVRP